jgi:hypothetical protein
LRQRLIEAERDGRPLCVYCGFDYTASDLHLGHTCAMLRASPSGCTSSIMRYRCQGAAGSHVR